MGHANELELDTTEAVCAIAAMSEHGDHAVVGDREGLRILGGGRLAADAVASAIVDREVWVVRANAGVHSLHRFDVTGAPVAMPSELGPLGLHVAITATRIGLRSALIEGERAVYVRAQDGRLEIEQLGARGRDRRVLLGGRGVAERVGATLAFRAGKLQLPTDLVAGTVVGGALVLDGLVALVEIEHAGRRTAVAFDPRRGSVKMRIRLGDARIIAVAERRGFVVLARGAHLALFDLRSGRCVGERILPAAALACAIDADAKRLVVLDASAKTHELAPSLADWSAPLASEPDAPTANAVPDAGNDGDTDPPDEDAAPEADPVEAAPASQEPPAIPRTTTIEIEGPDDDGVSSLSLVGLAAPRPRAIAPAALEQYLADMRAWVETLCAVAPEGAATPDAHAAQADATRRVARWTQPGTPHIEITRELGLSSLAISLLVVAAAPQIWGELARAYAARANDPARPLVDELALCQMFRAGSTMRAAISRELDDDAPLVASGALTVSRGVRPYAAITVHPAIARRLAGAAPADLALASGASRTLAEIIGPRAAIAAVARKLANSTSLAPRIVLRGGPGTGRRTTAAAFAAQAGRRLGLVEIEPTASDVDVRLVERLRDVALRGDLPCVDLTTLSEDPTLRARVRTALDRHRGPLFVRAPHGGDLPLAAGYLAIEFTALTEGDRCHAWTAFLAEHGFDIAPAARLAARFGGGPGPIARACAAVKADATTTDIEAALATFMRQLRTARIQAIATRVERLASWDDLVVPEDIADSLHELCARVRHRRTVLEDWGLRGVASTARGVTALFQGGPGTGKTMAAEVIANALGYELWRVDLSKVVSKWIGETEKNLGAVFDAAEEGEIVLLFDEADTLFGKRTEVQSSNDRNANLETNYLLQRLDTFTGVAILTTNFGTAIDPAFQRRLSVQAQFPFPDERDRERLWRALVPRSLPVGEELDFAALAHRFQISGGYIRNSILRAAYLAAGRGTPLTTADFERAVRAEYQSRGMVSTTGALR